MKQIVYKIGLLVSVFLVLSCSKKNSGDSGGGTGIQQVSIPRVLAPVGASASLQKIRAASVGMSIANGVPTNGTEPQNLNLIFSQMSYFLNYGNTSDTFSCIAEKLVNNGVITPDPNKNYVFRAQGSGGMRFHVEAENGIVTRYRLYSCQTPSDTSNSVFIEGGNINSEVSFTLKISVAGIKFYSTIGGRMSGTQWLSKGMTNRMSIPLGGALGTLITNDRIEQFDSHILMASSLSAQSYTYQLSSAFDLTGSSQADYAIGKGTLLFDDGSGVVTSNWNESGASVPVDDPTATYQSVATNNGFITPLTTFANDIAGDEIWDCQDASDSVIDVASIPQTTQDQLNACGQ